MEPGEETNEQRIARQKLERAQRAERKATTPSTSGDVGVTPERENPNPPNPGANEVSLFEIYSLVEDLTAEVAALRDENRALQATQTEHTRSFDLLESLIRRIPTATRISPSGTTKPKDEGFSLPGPSKGKEVNWGPSGDNEEEQKPKKGTKTPKFIIPEAYDGMKKGKEAKQWLTKMMVYINGNKHNFEDEEVAMTWFLTNMKGIAGDWAQVRLELIMSDNRSGDATDLEALWKAFGRDFDDPDAAKAAHRKLTKLDMSNNKTAHEYTLEFQNLQSYLSWNDDAYMAQYRLGLSWRIKQILSTRVEEPENLANLMRDVLKLDGQLRENDLERPAKATGNTGKASGSTAKVTTTTTTTSSDKKGPLSSSPNYVDKDEKDRRRAENLCIKCGKSGHGFKECTVGWKMDKKEVKEVKKESGKVGKIEEMEDSDSEDSVSGKD